jgi:chemotaxis protein methyltransferase CheR
LSNPSAQLFAILSGLVEDRLGLHYRLADRDVFLDKVSARAAEAGFDSLLDYYYRLRYDDPGGVELNALIDALVVPETYFFRELEPVQVALDEAIAPVVERGGRPRIWSAACASGEEPLTLAMLLAERGWLDRVELCASDLSLRSLGRAQDGRFSRRSLRGNPPAHLAHRWLRETPQGIECDRSLIDAVSWSQVNLLDAGAVRALGTFDLILCRNGLIYFSDQIVEQVIENLDGALRPEGVLLVGVSESLLRFSTSLECCERRGVFFYQRVHR